ncbi:MAG: PAS domain S-box protein [Spirochaetes bacterium]|nr:PAS domain S-box protein [Spirochaetota bacterium]
MSLIGTILRKYDAVDWLIKQKARTLLIFIAIGITVPIIDGTVTSLMLGRIAFTVYSDLLLILMAGISVVLLIRGKYTAASSAAILAIIVGLFFSRFLSAGKYAQDITYEVAQNAIILMFVIVFTALVAEKTAQLIITIALSMLIEFFYIAMVRSGIPFSQQGAFDAIALSKLLFIGVTGLVSALLFLNSRRAIAVAHSEGRISRENEQKFRMIFDSVNDAIFVHDVETGAILDVNRKMCEMYRCSREEALAGSISAFSANTPPYTAVEAARWLTRAREEGPQLFDWRARDRLGNLFWVEVNARCAEIGDAKRFLVVVRDISQRKTAEDRIASYTAELERSNRDLEDFAYIASHDLQEPLRKVRTFGDLLVKKTADTVGDEGRNYVTRMQQSTTRMQQLIIDLLAYSRVGTRGGIFEHVRLDDALDDALETLDLEIENAHARIERQPLPMIDADRSQMRQLFQNIIANAVKFRKPGLPPVIRITAVETDDGFVSISIEDNGIGFDETYRDKIFVIFQRLHGRDDFGGTGVGLAICKKIVERHGGTISAESTAGIGSRFTIRLPRVHTNA